MNKDEILHAQEVIDSVRNGTGELKPLKPEFPATSEGGTATPQYSVWLTFGISQYIGDWTGKEVTMENQYATLCESSNKEYAELFFKRVKKAETNDAAEIQIAAADGEIAINIPVASVEGQRTGEKAVDPEGDAAYWRARAETAELKVLTFHDEIVKLDAEPKDWTQQCPLCGSTAKENYLGKCAAYKQRGEPAHMFHWDLNAAPDAKADASSVPSVEGMGAREPDATTIAKAIAYWRDRALASESREQAMRENLKVSHNVLRTELGRKCDIQREDGLCEICRKN